MPKKGLRIKVIKEAMQHPDKLHAGATKRKELLTPAEDIDAIMREFNRGTLWSGNGTKVSNRKQAIAIALSESNKIKNKKER